MNSEQTLLLIGIVAVAALVGGWLLVTQLRALRERQWLHEERMTALRQGIATDPILTTASPLLRSGSEVGLFWVRLTTLALGLVSSFVGVGVVAGFMISDDPGLQDAWPVGLIPVFGGIGLLLFAILSMFLRPPHHDAAEREAPPQPLGETET